MEKTIDIHTHLFNLKYLPVAGILVRHGKGIIRPRMALAIERVLVNCTASDFDGTAGLNTKIEKSASKFLNLTPSEVNDAILEVIPSEELLDPIAIEGLEEFQEIALSEGVITPAEAVDFSPLKKQNNAALNDVPELKLRNLFRRLLDWICSKVKAIVNYLKWFRFMMQSETAILEYLMTKDETDVDLYIHHLMDVDYYFKSDEPNKYKSRFNYQVQIENMGKLNSQYKDKIRGFVAFDPSKEDCVKIVKDAINSKLFIGVKFYPPMGYHVSDGSIFKDRIDELLKYCNKDEIPIFTHCNKKGFEAHPESHSGHNSNPQWWKSILPKYPDLRLCLAHAGGGEGWFAENKTEDQILENTIKDLIDGQDENQVDWNSSYAKIVYQLCLIYPNVYCDAAYWDEITEQQLYDNLKKRLLNLFQKEPRFINKIIYGSDWHMLFQEGINYNYAGSFKQLFNEPGYTVTQRDSFFSNNALAYLKMLSI